MSALHIAVEHRAHGRMPSQVPVEVRTQSLALAGRLIAPGSIQVKPGTYHIRATLPDGRELYERAEAVVAVDTTVTLTLSAAEALVRQPSWLVHHPGAVLQPTAGTVGGGRTPESDSARLRMFRGQTWDDLGALQLDWRAAPHWTEDGIELEVGHGGDGLIQLLQARWPALNMRLPIALGQTCGLNVIRQPDGTAHIDLRLANSAADSLLRYTATGLHAEARVLAASAAMSFETLLSPDAPDPIAAVVCAYSLFRFGEVDHLNALSATLMAQFPSLADGVVIRAEHLARLGEHELALTTLLGLSSRGLPIFNDGLAYAIDRLRLYVSAGEPQFQATQLEPAARLLDRLEQFAAYADSRGVILAYTGLSPDTPDAEPLGANVAEYRGVDLRRLLNVAARMQRAPAGLGQRLRGRQQPAAGLTLNGVSGSEGQDVAIEQLSLAVRPHEYFALIGPPKSGVTTVARLVAGFDEPSSGDVYIGSRRVNGVSPIDRDIASVFQPMDRDVGSVFPSFALFPRMSVFDNLAFGLRLRKTPKVEVERRVRAAAEIVGLSQVLGQMPGQLSPSQRRLAALARALVRDPAILLLDESASGPDPEWRTAARTLLKQLQTELGWTVLGTSSDARLADVADRVAVMRDGVLEQVGSRESVYDMPVNTFVGGFLGDPGMNFVRGRLNVENDALFFVGSRYRVVLPPDWVTALDAVRQSAVVYLGVRPEYLRVIDQPDVMSIPIQVRATTERGRTLLVSVQAGDQMLSATTEVNFRPSVGRSAWVRPDIGRTLIFDEATGRRIVPPVAMVP